MMRCPSILMMMALAFSPGCGSDDEDEGTSSSSFTDENGNVIFNDPTGPDDAFVGDDDSAPGTPSSGTQGSPSTGPQTPDNFVACATGSASADVSPVAMLIMFDRSGSMNEDNKWPDATEALIAFLEDPETNGLSIGLRFFGDDEPAAGCRRGQCNVDACSVPLVDPALLTPEGGNADPQENALVSAIEQRNPHEGYGTPISAALGGALQWGEDYADANPDERAVVIFVTDGEPNGCEHDIDVISGLAADSFESHGVLTYAIGLEGSNESQMDAIAEQGGTGEGIFIGSSGGTARDDLLAALGQIRGQTLQCDFAVPEPDSGDLDPDLVNVELASPSMTTSFGRADDEDACTSDDDEELQGWYYSGDGSRIHLCPAACELALSTANAELNLTFGCESETLPGSGGGAR